MKASASMPARLEVEDGFVRLRTRRGRGGLRTGFLSRWREFKGRILRRQAPHAVLSWRYFLPGQSPNVRLHRNAFMRAWPRLPRLAWFIIALYSYSLWYLFHAWRQVLSAWWRWGSGVEDRQGVSRPRQLLGLAILAYGHAMPPSYYYRYKLHECPESRWLDFVFTHELPNWHHALSPELGARTTRLMGHKHAFASAMEEMGLPAVETRMFLRRGEPIPGRLFGGQSLFLKPESGSRKKGCLELLYDPVDGSYVLNGREPVAGEWNILIAMMEHVEPRDYIAQPLLRNHSELARRCGTDRLATIRLITRRGPNGGQAFRACLEIPVEGNSNRIHPMNIDIATGALSRFEDPPGDASPSLRESLERLEKFRLPLWRDMVAIAEAAHRSFLDLYSIGWDLGLTDQGVMLLEGNINWAVAVHQLAGRPLLGDAGGGGDVPFVLHGKNHDRFFHGA